MRFQLLFTSMTAALLATSTMCLAVNAQERPARAVPPPGIEIPGPTKAALQRKRTELSKKIAQLNARKRSEIERYVPDVEIFARSVQLALDGNTFYAEQDFKNAEAQLDIGLQRADELLKGEPSWTKQTGLVVRGYRSKLDGTVQPYGLVIGPDVKFDDKPVRCDLWLRGRSEKGPELQFINDRLTKQGEYQFNDGMVLHPMGRYCNANRFAGEVDVFEALEHAQANYNIDEDRIAIGGFSMGGASCWGLTVHYPSKWVASYPGAGFSETKRFLGMDKNPDRLPSEIQQKLWNLYDANSLADNLFNIPTIAYSGETDGQKMAADIMVAAAAEKGLTLPHVIGPMTGHKIHPDSKKEISEKISEFVAAGRPACPPVVRFTTYTLKYNECYWVRIDGLKEHWAESTIAATLKTPEQPQTIEVKTTGITAFSLDFTAAKSPFRGLQKITVSIDGQPALEIAAKSDNSLLNSFELVGDQWKVVRDDNRSTKVLAKKHNLQGPIDDALMGPFLFVQPSGKFTHPKIEKWVKEEQARAANNWQRQMRGLARIRRDNSVTAAEIRDNNLVLWGCPKSNTVIRKILPELPIEWNDNTIKIGDQSYPADQTVVTMIFPNPLNSERYIVLNSGLTYREIDYENNARQTPKLPDWAIIDVSQAPNDYTPGKILNADFFDEKWQVKK